MGHSQLFDCSVLILAIGNVLQQAWHEPDPWIHNWLCDFGIAFPFLSVLQAIGLEGDVRKQEDAVRVLESTIKHFGRLDILVNAAAGNFLVPAEDLSPKGFQTGCVTFYRTTDSYFLSVVEFSF